MPVTPLPQALAGIKALFDQNYIPLRDAQGQIVAPLLAGLVRIIPSTQAEEVLTALGAAPGLEEFKGEITPEKLAAWKQTVINRTFDASIEVARNDWEDDRLGQYDASLQDMAGRATFHPAELVGTCLEANPTAFDGTALFSTSRVIMESGTINNALVPAMAGTAPTVLEVETAIKAAIEAMKAFKNNKGKPAILAGKFTFVVPSALVWQFKACAEDDQIGAAGALKTNEVKGQFTWIEQPFLTSGVVAYLAVTGYGAKPVVMTDREPLSMTQDGPETENWRLNDKSITRVRCRREVAAGVPWLIARLTFTHA